MSSRFMQYLGDIYIKTTQNSEIRFLKQLGCLASKKSLYKSSKSTNISTNISICTNGGSLIPITTIPNSKAVHSRTLTKNIYIVSNVEKLVWHNLISLFCEGNIWIEFVC